MACSLHSTGEAGSVPVAQVGFMREWMLRLFHPQVQLPCDWSAHVNALQQCVNENSFWPGGML